MRYLSASALLVLVSLAGCMPGGMSPEMKAQLAAEFPHAKRYVNAVVYSMEAIPNWPSPEGVPSGGNQGLRRFGDVDLGPSAIWKMSEKNLVRYVRLGYRHDMGTGRITVKNKASPIGSPLMAHGHREVRTIMRRSEEGLFRRVMPRGMGWTMSDSKGEKYHMSGLVEQAKRIIPFGRAAVPELMNWLSHDEKYMRFIAAYSLKQITGEQPTFYYFGPPGKPFNDDDEWFEKCVGVWRKWYEENKEQAEPTQ